MRNGENCRTNFYEPFVSWKGAEIARGNDISLGCVDFFYMKTKSHFV